MFQFNCHGSYIRDFSRPEQGDVKRAGDITEAEAWRLLIASRYVTKGRPDDVNNGLLLNKGFAVVAREGDRAVMVYNHDGSYSRWTGSWAFFAAKYGLKETP